MHGAHIAMTGLLQSVPIPTAKAAERTSSMQESFSGTWEKAIKAGAANVQPMKNDGSTPRKPKVIVDQDEKPDDAIDSVKALEDEASQPRDKRLPIAALTTKAFVEAQPQKKLATANDKQVAAETKKHKVQDDGNTEPPDEPKPPTEATVAVGLLVAPAPVATQSSVILANVKSDGKDVAKTDAPPAKRDRVNIAKADNTGKPVDAKPAVEGEDSKALPVADAKAKVFDATAVPTAANHADVPVGNSTQGNGGIAQGTAGQGVVATTAAPLAHKTAGLQVAAELQNNAPPVGADVNPPHVLGGGPGQLEVGVLDGTHGWLKIRAELGTDGSVNALLTSNATAHEGLREAVPALSGYLVSESVNVGKIAVHRAPESSAAGGDMTNANGGSDGTDGGTASSNQGGGRSASSTTNSLLRANAYAPTQQDMDSSMNGISPAVFGGASAGFSGDGIGSWLSVTV
jgi:hypothetical protein